MQSPTGVVLGTLFRADPAGGYATVTALDERESQVIVGSSGCMLIDSYWGRYVAILRRPGEPTALVIRDPSGGLPCLLLQWRGVHVVFACIEDCLRLDLGPFTIDWSYLAAHTACSMLQSSATALQEVRELQGGESVTLGERQPRFHFLWHPRRVWAQEPLEDRARCADRVRDTTLDCVGAWVHAYPRVLHRLSGGLDSSILLSCLADAPAQEHLQCINYYTPGSDGDERHYARAAAGQYGCSLLEREIHGARLRMEPLSCLTRSARPASYVPHLVSDTFEPEVIATHHLDAYCDGNGGDQLFYSGHYALAAADYLRCNGAGSEFLRVCLQTARMSGASVWSVLAQSVARLVGPHRQSFLDGTPDGTGIVSAEATDGAHQLRCFLHPWVLDALDLPPGKLWHLFMLSFRSEFYNPLRPDEEAEPMRPFTSQPLLELCLRIPTYVLTDGPIDRPLARRAFASRLPAQIVFRSSKGGAITFASDLLAANRQFVRETLLDGQLAARGILNRRRLADALSGQPTMVKTSSTALLECLSTELWIAAWAGASKPAQ